MVAGASSRASSERLGTLSRHAIMRRSTVLLLCVLCAGVLAANAEQRDSLFSFGGLDALRDPECVPESYRLPKRASDIADQCLRLVEDGFENLEQLSSELAALNDPSNRARSTGTSVRRFQLGVRDCMSELMGIVDDNGEFVKERLEEEIAALGFPEEFERDVQSASRACLHHTPANLSVEQRQNFYYVCRDSLLEGHCLYKRLARNDPDRALDIGIKQTECLQGVKPTRRVVAAMDQCRYTYSVPVQYATLRRSLDNVVEEEGSGAEPPVIDEEEEEEVLAEEGELVSVVEVEEEEVEVEEEDSPAIVVDVNELSVAERVNLFIYCVYETIGVLQPDGEFNPVPLIEQLRQFEGNEKAVKLQVDAATRCQDSTTLEAYNMCYYDDISSGCHIFKVQQAFLAGDPALLPEY